MYYALSCQQCATYLSFGKKLARGFGHQLQGLYSERQGRWIDGEQAFKGVGAFLMRHENHSVVFAVDDVVRIDELEEADVDALLSGTGTADG